MISPFEYISVFLAIILGVGVTQLVTGFAEIIHRWHVTKTYWPHMALIALVFVLHIQEWWAIYEMRGYDSWRLPVFLFLALYPVNLYILARILFPVEWSKEGCDLKQFYFENYRRIYLFTILLAVLAIINNLFIEGRPVAEQVFQFFIILLLSVVVGRKHSPEWLHKAVILVLLASVVLVFVIEWNAFLIVNI